MIFDRCKNCKYYDPYQIKVKSIFSSKVKTKHLREGVCNAVTVGIYKPTSNNEWCEKYKRKMNEKKNKHYVCNYTCPVCHEILSNNEDCNYCPACGTKLDWSQNEK